MSTSDEKAAMEAYRSLMGLLTPKVLSKLSAPTLSQIQWGLAQKAADCERHHQLKFQQAVELANGTERHRKDGDTGK